MDFTTLKENLVKLGYTVSEFETAKDATKYLDEQIDQTTVGIGGSITIDQMGVYEALASHNEVYWHWRTTEQKPAPYQIAQASGAKIYLSSANGVAETGEIINIDGNGNRVAALQFGHEKAYIIVGENKIAPDYDAALYRARNIAGPLNAQRLNKKTPCAVNGDKCYNCSSPDRICNGLSVFWNKPYGMAYEVVLIHENLGY